MMADPACVNCAFYVKPGFWRRYARGMFAETCSHPECRDAVDGSPLPCVTMRLIECAHGRLFKPNG